MTSNVMITNFMKDLSNLYNKNIREKRLFFSLSFGLLLYKKNSIILLKDLLHLKINNFNGSIIPSKYIMKNRSLNVNIQLTNNELNAYHKTIFNRTNENKENIRINLAGVNNISNEGYELITQIIKSNSKNCFKIQFNDYNNLTNEYNVWLFYKNSIFSKWVNCNILLIENGLGNVKQIPNSVEDIKIYNYVCEMIEGEKKAKLKQLGIYKKIRTEYQNTDYAKSNVTNYMSLSFINKKIKHYIDMGKAEKIFVRNYK